MNITQMVRIHAYIIIIVVRIAYCSILVYNVNHVGINCSCEFYAKYAKGANKMFAVSGIPVDKDFGEIYTYQCVRCNNVAAYHLFRSIQLVWAAFIIVFPEQIDYMLMCPICGYKYILDRGHFKRLIPIAKLYSKYKNGEITHEIYDREFNILNKQVKVFLESKEKPLKERIIQMKNSLLCKLKLSKMRSKDKL